MFKVGDRIVYPMYGAGIIEEIEEAENDDVIDNYYVIRIPSGNLKIKVSAKKTDIIGIRPVSCEMEINKAIDTVTKVPIAIQANWNVRYKENLEKIRSGKLEEVIEVSRNLILRERERGLSGAEKKMLNNAKQIVISEIAYSKGINIDEAEEYFVKKLLD